jgi:2-amino-4-hydroxy-6-hydroxymethyldihydropteridine diphosphokinase
MTRAYLGVGSNVGDRAAFCRRAVESLRRSPGISVGTASSLYETSPVGGPPQRSFVNLVVEIETEVSARELLGMCKEIERRLGREPGEIRWGPRVADLDILTYGEDKVNEPDLEIPHPRLTSRRFVLIPLLEVDPAAADPWGARYADFLDEAEGDVQRLESF